MARFLHRFGFSALTHASANETFMLPPTHSSPLFTQLPSEHQAPEAIKKIKIVVVFAIHFLHRVPSALQVVHSLKELHLVSEMLLVLSERKHNGEKKNDVPLQYPSVHSDWCRRWLSQPPFQTHQLWGLYWMLVSVHCSGENSWQHEMHLIKQRANGIVRQFSLSLCSLTLLLSVLLLYRFRLEPQPVLCSSSPLLCTIPWCTSGSR